MSQSNRQEHTSSMDAAQHWIDCLHLEPHPEGGWYRQTYQSPLMLPQSALPDYPGERTASTAIYFLLAGDQFSAFHRLRSDEVWHFYAGSGLVVHVVHPQGAYTQVLLGSDAAAGEQFQAVVPADAGSAPRCGDPTRSLLRAAPCHLGSTSQTSRSHTETISAGSTRNTAPSSPAFVANKSSHAAPCRSLTPRTSP